VLENMIYDTLIISALVEIAFNVKMFLIGDNPDV